MSMSSLTKQASLKVFMSDCSFIVGAVKDFENSNLANYGASEEFVSDLVAIANDCQALWSEDDWHNYREIFFDQPFDESIPYDDYNHSNYWTVSITDCDSIILALQFLEVSARNAYASGDINAVHAMTTIQDVLIPKFTNLFTHDEWKAYDVEAA